MTPDVIGGALAVLFIFGGILFGYWLRGQDQEVRDDRKFQQGFRFGVLTEKADRAERLYGRRGVLDAGKVYELRRGKP